jgi:hypothetical protein
MFTRGGHRVFSVGAYSFPRSPEDVLRPPLQEFFHPDDWQEFLDSGCSGTHITREFARHFDVVIVNHYPEWISDNLAAFADKPVVYRSIGQSIPTTERKLAAIRERIHVVRYSHHEVDVPDFVSADAVIYFGKYKDDYPAWRGSRKHPISFYNQYVFRGAFCGPRPQDLDAICEDWTCEVFGRESLSLASGQGCVSYEEQGRLYRDAPAYMYIHTLPASYLLNLIEAMAVGIPILAPDYSLLRSWHGEPHLRDQAFSCGRYEVPSLLDPVALYSSNKEGREKLDLLQRDQSICIDLSQKEQTAFFRYFDASKIAGEWSSFLHSIV